MDKVLVLSLAPFVVLVLIIGWLVHASMGGRAIRLKVKGLGLQIDIDTTQGNRERRHSERSVIEDAQTTNKE